MSCARWCGRTRPMARTSSSCLRHLVWVRAAGQTMTDEQIQTVCSEAKAVGLRSVVHAIGNAGARAAVLAGCTSIEHGTFLKDETLDLMVKRGTFFDPNLLVLHNYLDRTARASPLRRISSISFRMVLRQRSMYFAGRGPRV